MTIDLSIRYKKNTDLIISVNDFKRQYLFGLNIERYGQPIPEDVYTSNIESAQQMLEEMLQIKLVKQSYSEQKSFWSTDWASWGYIPTQYPVVCPLEVSGFIGTVKQVLYPKEWLSVKHTSDNQYLQRQMHLVPNTNSSYNQMAIYSGVTPNINWFSNSQIPNYWMLNYVTGWDKNQIPKTIIQAVAKIAALNILAIAQDMLLPFPGVNSQSLSLDGLSQSLSQNQNGVFANRMQQYGNDLFGKDGKGGELKRLRDTYTSIIFMTM